VINPLSAFLINWETDNYNLFLVWYDSKKRATMLPTANIVKRLTIILMLCAGAAQAQELRALSNVDTENSRIFDRMFGGISIELSLSQAIPFRIFTRSSPNRVIMDFRELEWSSAEAIDIVETEIVNNLRFGVFQSGWTRLVLPISEPLLVQEAHIEIEDVAGTARLSVQLGRTSQEKFDAASVAQPDKEWLIEPVTFDAPPRERQKGDRPVVIAIDPGHGGLDPGAVVSGFKEKDLVLVFAKELREALDKTGQYNAFLTREGDDFTSLTGRISRARKGRADVLISLHADALSEGSASGITVYTLSNKASNEAAEQLATQLDRADLLAGVDLSEQDEAVTSVLMDLARIETNARSIDLAGDIVEGIAQATQRSRSRPQLAAAFTVLKAPDIPSILVELGFLTNKSDLRNLLNEQWRHTVQQGILHGLANWSVEDAAQARLLRK
jgi:N-acetylmuramoyl-L-alanine amidase